jgi:hypothetical protein
VNVGHPLVATPSSGVTGVGALMTTCGDVRALGVDGGDGAAGVVDAHAPAATKAEIHERCRSARCTFITQFSDAVVHFLEAHASFEESGSKLSATHD